MNYITMGVTQAVLEIMGNGMDMYYAWKITDGLSE
jgi:hypothetical protein